MFLSWFSALTKLTFAKRICRSGDDIQLYIDLARLFNDETVTALCIFLFPALFFYCVRISLVALNENCLWRSFLFSHVLRLFVTWIPLRQPNCSLCILFCLLLVRFWILFLYRSTVNTFFLSGFWIRNDTTTKKIILNSNKIV